MTVLELRQYKLHPGQREVLIELFERELVEPQEAAGMSVLAQFRNLDNPDRFVWLRGFGDMESRTRALETFYGGPVWKAHKTAANATMIDSDDVLLLRPATPGSGFVHSLDRPAALPPPGDGSIVAATIYLLRERAGDAFLEFFERSVAPLMAETGAPPLARYVSEYAPNGYPALPVREGEHAFVWFATFASAAGYDRHLAALAASPAWRQDVEPQLSSRLARPVERLRLAPTARSALRHLGPWGFTRSRRGDVRDFDFLAGEWNVSNRRLRQRGVGCTDWDEFAATCRVELRLGGVVNVDEIRFATQGWSGMTVRVFNHAERQWAIYWVNSAVGTLLPPVRGGFDGDRGEFYGEDTEQGRLVKVRYVWTKLGPGAARWEQAFSFEDGAWEVNWVMQFARVVSAHPSAR